MARPSDLELAEQIVERWERVPIETLFRCIHAVNPTDRGLKDRVEQRRYELKAALQSLLIELYGDALVVQPHPIDPALVSLQHRSGTRDAAHARVPQLRDRAREWVQARLIDTDDEAEDAAGVAPSDEQGAPPLARARAAADRYEIDDADALFREALETSPGLATATAFVDFLVEKALRPADALALPIPEPLLRAGRIRIRLAEAAEAIGDTDAALVHAGGLRGMRAAAVLRRVAAARLDAKDVAGATLALDRARDADPSNGEIRALQERLKQLKKERRRPQEDAVADAVRREAWDDARALVAALAKAEGETAAVRHRRQEIERGAARAEAARLVAEADRAADPIREATLLTQARSLGRTDLEDRIVTLHARITEARRAAAVDAMVTLFGADHDEGLAAFAALDPEGRRAARARADHPDLELLDQLRAEARTADEALAALQALFRARRAADRGEPEQVLALLDEAGLSTDPATRSLRERAKRDHADRELRSRQAQLSRAEDARARGDADTCRRVVDDLVVRDAADRARVEVLREWLEELDTAARDEATWGSLASARLPLDARDFAQDRVELDPVWRGRASWAQARIQALFAPTEHDLVGVDGLPHDIWLRLNEAWVWAASPAGPIAVLEPMGRVLLVRELDPDTSRVTRAWSVRLPRPLEGKVCHGWDGGLLWVIAIPLGCALVVDPRDLRIVSWCELDAFTRGRRARTANVVDGIAWLACGENENLAQPGKDAVVLVDLARRRAVGSDRVIQAPTHVPGDPPRAVGYAMDRHTERGPVLVCDGHGRRLAELGVVGGNLQQALPDPEGGVLAPTPVGGVVGPTALAGGDPFELRLLRCAEGRPPVPAAFDPPLFVRFSIVTADRPSKLLFAHVWDGRSTWLAAYRAAAPDRFEQVWRVEPSPGGCTVTTPDGRAVWFACRSQDGRSAAFHRLGPGPPIFDHAHEWQLQHPPQLAVHRCTMPRKQGPFRASDLEPGGPADPHLELNRAHLEMERRDWDAVYGILADLDLDRLAGPSRKHALHLLGAARAYRGDTHGAHEAWTEALEVEGSCAIHHELNVLAGLFAGDSLKADMWLGRKLLAVCRESDKRLAAGDAAGAFAVLDHVDGWEARELQTHLRRAAAALRWTDGPAVPRLRAMAVALDRLDPARVSAWPDLPVAEHWGPARWKEVERGLRAALGLDADPPAPPWPERAPAPPPSAADPVVALLGRVADAAERGELGAARDCVRRLEENGAAPTERAEAHRLLQRAAHRLRAPLAEALREASSGTDPDAIAGRANALLEWFPDDIEALAARRAARQLRKAPSSASVPPPTPAPAPPALAPPVAQATQTESRPPAPAPPPQARPPPPPGELPSWVKRIEPVPRVEPVDAPLPGCLRVHLEPPGRSAVPLRLELVPEGPRGEQAPFPCPSSDREARKRVRGLTADELATVRIVDNLAQLFRHGVHETSREMVARQLVDLLTALSQVDVRFEGRNVSVDWTPLRPRVRATGDEDGLDLAWWPRPAWVWRQWPGLVLDEELVLRPLAEEAPSRVLETLGDPLPRIPRTALDAFVRDAGKPQARFERGPSEPDRPCAGTALEVYLCRRSGATRSVPAEAGRSTSTAASGRTNPHGATRRTTAPGPSWSSPRSPRSASRASGTRPASRCGATRPIAATNRAITIARRART